MGGMTDDRREDLVNLARYKSIDRYEYHGTKKRNIQSPHYIYFIHIQYLFRQTKL